MISDGLAGMIRGNFGHEPTPEQEQALGMCAEFLLSRSDEGLFLLKGYAGTGKTSLVAALVRTMRALSQPTVLLAPTGRAAKVFSLYSGTPASTIHKRIYRQKTLDAMDAFQACPNLSKNTLFIVDEASMIANEGFAGSVFGSGRLLDDLVKYVYSSEGCRMVLVGDTAQLPPVGEEESPALDKDMLEGYGLDVTEVRLTQVVRQADESGILWNATRLRMLIQNDDVYDFPRFRVAGFPDVSIVPGGDLIEALEEAYASSGVDGTIVVTRSNKRACIFNNGIRARILDCDGELCGGDRVMVAKNNYFWVKEDFIANGETAVVRRVRHERSFYGFHFADATLRFPDMDNQEVEVTILMDTLQGEAPALTRQQQETLFQAVWDDYPEITNRRDKIKKIKADPYYNALQIKYAYAVTGHKAQGGQWENVFIDQGYITQEMLSPDYFRWLYTALTRATEKVYLINWPEQQVE